MAAHRYWRLLVARNTINARIQLAELGLRSAPSGPSVATGGTVLSSGTSAGDPSNVFDGNTATQWDSSLGGGQHWIGYQFAAPVDIVEYSARTGSNSSFVSEGVSYLQFSDDGVGWALMGPSAALSAVSTTYIVSVLFEFRAAAPPPGGSVQAFPPVWPARIVGLTPSQPVYRAFWGGLGRIVGTTKIKGTPNTPVRRRVRLIRAVDAVCVGERWSDPVTGAYTFNGFDPLQLYTVIVYDGPRVFRAAVQDAVVPEVYIP